MKILQLITTLNPGGAENHLLMLCRGLKARDHEVEVAYLLPGYNHLVREFERSGIPVHALNMHSRYDWSVVRRTAALLSRGQYDVVHTHLIRADYVGAAARLWARLPGRLVSSKHNDDWFYKTIPVALLERQTSRCFQRTIAISKAVKEFFCRRHLVSDPEQMKVIHYGLDLAGYDQRLSTSSRQAVREVFGLKPTECVFISAGRLEEQKGHRYLIDAFAQIHSHFPQARLWIVGEGSLRLQLTRQIQQHGIADRVSLLGWRSDLPQLLNAADVFVFPSLWEGFGLVLLEAMAARLPVIASRISAIPEIVEDGVIGRLLPARDVAALTEALTDYLADEPRRQAEGHVGRDRVVNCFGLDSMLAQTMAVYEGLLND